eukprot:jgi/Mesvir1/5423/Mv15486-RA.1
MGSKRGPWRSSPLRDAVPIVVGVLRRWVPAFLAASAALMFLSVRLISNTDRVGDESAPALAYGSDGEGRRLPHHLAAPWAHGGSRPAGAHDPMGAGEDVPRGGGSDQDEGEGDKDGEGDDADDEEEMPGEDEPDLPHASQRPLRLRRAPGHKEAIARDELYLSQAETIFNGISLPSGNGWPGACLRQLVLNERTMGDGGRQKLFSRTLTKSLFRHHCLPVEDYVRRFTTCAVVGNGGIMLEDATLGAVIDAHDAVFRFNDGPTRGFEPFVGKRTTFRALNNNWTRQLLDRRQLRGVFRAPGVTMLTFGLSAKKHFFELCRTFPSLDVLFLDPKLSLLARHVYHKVWKKMERMGIVKVSGRNSAPTGIEGLLFALAVCEDVHLYGFHLDLASHRPYHYHDKVTAGLEAHSFNFQGAFMKLLHTLSAVTVCHPPYASEECSDVHHPIYAKARRPPQESGIREDDLPEQCNRRRGPSARR